MRCSIMHHDMLYHSIWNDTAWMLYQISWDAVSDTMRCWIRHHEMLNQTPWDAESDTMRCCVRHQAETLAAPCSVDCYQVTTQYILLVITTSVLILYYTKTHFNIFQGPMQASLIWFCAWEYWPYFSSVTANHKWNFTFHHVCLGSWLPDPMF